MHKDVAMLFVVSVIRLRKADIPECGDTLLANFDALILHEHEKRG